MYVVFEGDNNTGKSTQLPLVVDLLEKSFKLIPDELPRPKINTFHEGDTCNDEYETLTEEILDYARDRARTQNKIQPSDSPNITITDRSFYSSIVYQGKWMKKTRNIVKHINSFAKEPDQVYLFYKDWDTLPTKLYREVIPYELLTPINTETNTIETTTHVLATLILYTWLEYYSDYGEEEIDEILEKIPLRGDYIP